MNTTSYPANELDVCLYLTNVHEQFDKPHPQGRPKCYTELGHTPHPIPGLSNRTGMTGRCMLDI